MGQPVVLPKFELQGDKPHWAIRAAWVAGGVLLFSIVGLAAVIMHHRTLETQAHIAKAEAIARVKAEAEAKIAAAAAAAAALRAEKELARSAKLAAQSVPATTVPAAGSTEDTPSGPKPSKSARSHHGRFSHGGKGAKLFPKVGGKSDSGRPAPSGKPDPIDELLKKMK